MLLFKKWFIPQILGEAEPLKNTTRRGGRLRWRIGAIHTFKTNYNNDSAFAKAKILRVYRQHLFDMNEDDAFREGFWSLEEFKKAWIKINGNYDNQEVWVIDFVVVENLLNPTNSKPLSKIFKLKS